jgi:RNA polymerase sigma-B factor
VYRTDSFARTDDADRRRATGRTPNIEDAGLDADRLSMRISIRELPDDQQRIVHLRFYEGLTQSEIAGRLGISQVQVSRVLRRIYGRLGPTLQTSPN